MSEIPKQYIMAPNGVPSPLLTHMMNKRRNKEGKAPCANQCEAQAFMIEARMSAARITELESMLSHQHKEIQQLMAKLEAAEKDAARYRYLFSGDKVYTHFRDAYDFWDGCGGKDGFDAVVDSAIRGDL